MPYAKDGRKVCSTCRIEKPVSEFYKSTAKDGYHNQCKPCKIAAAKRWRQKNPRSYSADWHRMRRYGLTREEYLARLEACGGRCEICRELPHPSIGQLDCDHDHTTMKFRGLLCRDCNNALRCEDPAILRAMAEYLERHMAAVT